MSDKQLVQILQNVLLNPASDFYRSTLLFSPDQKPLELCEIDEMELGDFDIGGIPVGVVVKNMVVRGLSNAQIQFDQQGTTQIVAVGNEVTFTARQANTQVGYERPSDLLAYVEAKGDLHITINGDEMPSGALNLTIKTMDKIHGVFSAEEEVSGQLDSAKITFSALTLEPVISNGNMAVVADLQNHFVEAINKMLNEDSSLQLLLDELNRHISSPQSLAIISQAATTQTRLALADFKRNEDSKSTSDLYMVLPKAMFDDYSSSIFEALKSEIGGTSRLESLGLTVTWKLTKAPDFNFDDGYSSEIFSWCHSQISLEVEPDDGPSDQAFVDVSVKVSLNFGPVSGTDKYVYTCHANLLSFDADEFTKAILMAKQSEILSEINSVLSEVVIPVLGKDFIYPATKTNNSGPLEGGLLLDYSLDFHDLNKISEPSVHPVPLGTLDPDGFHAHMVSTGVVQLIENYFWAPLNKKYVEENATIELSGYEVGMSTSSDSSIKLMIHIRGKVEIGSAYWSMTFFGPLIGRLVPYVNDKNEVKMQLHGMENTFMGLHPENFAAVALEWMLPGLENHVEGMIRYRLTEDLESGFDAADLIFYTFKPVRFNFKSRTLDVYPSNVKFNIFPTVVSLGFNAGVTVVK